MSFTGDLEHLPIVDVIQLLHATRKSGILRISCRKGESQLVFKDGYIVSANHLNNSVRIGKILIDLHLITQEILDQTLADQKNAGKDRKPLIITLIEKGVVNEKDAYRGLEQLIEMTVVEILTWKGGTFTLDVMPQSVADEYRYFPEQMNREINVDTQGILMNALRIFDEKMRDGQIREDDFPEDEDDIVLEAPPSGEEIPPISLDDLGLAELDQLEDRLPEVYLPLEDADPCIEHRHTLEKIAPELSIQEKDALAAYLGELSLSECKIESMEQGGSTARNILFYSWDELFMHCVSTVCKHAGMSVFATNEEQDIEHLIYRFLADKTIPLLVIDCPKDSGEGFPAEKLTSLRVRIREKYPRLAIIQLSSPRDFAFTMQAYGEGVRAVMPRLLRDGAKEVFVADTIQFLQTFRGYMQCCVREQQHNNIERVRSCIREFCGLRGAPEAALILLKLVARLFERSVTLIVRDKELIVEKGIGIRGEKGVVSSPPSMALRIPRSEPSLFQDVIAKGQVFYGDADDAQLRDLLFPDIGAPESSSILLLPLRFQGKTVSMTYGDFGCKEPDLVDLGLLEVIADQAELALENAMYRKKFEKPAVTG
jgi:hypothetical protein